ESELCWEGEYLINPFADEKTTELVDLEKSAGLRNYLYPHEQRLRQRYIAQASPENWYRTIDRVWPSLVKEPKLVIPDIQSGNVVGYDRGEFYPHHNLYWITSSTWNLRALQAIMRSNFVRLQVEAYSVQMRGGSLRYQAQTLRLIRIPTLATLRESDIEEFASLASCESVQPIDDLLHQVLDREGINLEKSF
ncbi:MAG: modification methylase PaeR7I, partial [Candidatus Kapaibacterium sp.]